jgi:hypothetical protein
MIVANMTEQEKHHLLHNERHIALRDFFHKCAHKYGDDKISTMDYTAYDRGDENEAARKYTMCYNKTKPDLAKYCGPDCFFHSWPTANIRSFEETKNQIIVESAKPPCIDKIGWFGNIYSPLGDVIEHKTRPLLYKIGQDNREWFDVIHILPRNGYINETIPEYLTLPYLTKYKYLIDIGGNGWSGRLKWLLFSKRPLLLVDRNYIEYFYNDLIPYKHYIPVKMDLSDLLEQAEWMRNNYDKSLEIAKNAFEYAMENFTEDKLIDRVYQVYQNINA